MRLDRVLLLAWLFIAISCVSDTKVNKENSNDSKKKVSDRLPILGHREFSNGDTLYHRIPDFIFTNQDSVFITSDSIKGKISIANFFFTTCPSICPTMTKQMKRLQDSLSLDSNLVVFLSHTIDPKNDLIFHLKEFAIRYEANLFNWHFLRGEMDYLYEIAKEGYLSTALEDEQEPGGFLHSQYFILVDPDRRIRGTYDGTNPKDVDQLVLDFEKLKNEYYGN